MERGGRKKIGQGGRGLNSLWRRIYFDYRKLRVSTTEWQWTVEAGESNGMTMDGQNGRSKVIGCALAGRRYLVQSPDCARGIRNVAGNGVRKRRMEANREEGGRQRGGRMKKAGEKASGAGQRDKTRCAIQKIRDKKRPESRSAFGALVCVALFSDGSAAGCQSLIPFCFSFSYGVL